MKSTASISLSDEVLSATRQWAASEHRALSHHIEMILSAAIAKRSKPTARKPRGGNQRKGALV